MKYAVSFFSFDESVDFTEAMQECKKAGYQGVEFVLSNTGAITGQTPEKEILQLKRTADDIGVAICSVGTWNCWENNLATNVRGERKRAMDHVRRQIEVAALCGADTVLVVPGYTGTPFIHTKPVSYDVAYQCAQEALGVLADDAKRAGVTIAIENVWNKFLLSPLEMCRFLDEIHSDYVKAYFDIGNIIYIGYPEQWIRILGKRIKRLQFDDCRADQCGLGMFVDLFEGDVDYGEVMKAIREIEYDEWAVVEFFPGYKRYPYQSVINARLSLDRLMGEPD